MYLANQAGHHDFSFAVTGLFEEGGPNRLLVGRGSQCAWTISVPGWPLLLSRQHAEFARLGEDVSVRDLSSCNGT